MGSNDSSVRSCMTEIFSDCLYEKHDFSSDSFIEDVEILEDHIYNLDENEFEEVFADHVLMGERLKKTLYAGKFEDFEDFPNHPPIALTGLALELFSKAVPNYGIDILNMDYVSSASETAKISPYAMIVAMIYLERLQIKNSDYLETVSPSGLFVVTMLVASKFLFENEEDVVTNQLWAEYLNFDIKELNNLEREFLDAIEWQIFVDSSEYFRQLYEIEKIIAIKQSSLRGWLSYSDVYILMQDMFLQAFFSSCFKQIAKTTFLWTLGYVTTAFALYGSGCVLQKYAKSEQSSDLLEKINEKSIITNGSENTFYLDEKQDLLIDPELPSLFVTISEDNQEPCVQTETLKLCHTMSVSKFKLACLENFKRNNFREFNPCFVKYTPKEFPSINCSNSKNDWLRARKIISVSIM